MVMVGGLVGGLVRGMVWSGAWYGWGHGTGGVTLRERGAGAFLFVGLYVDRPSQGCGDSTWNWKKRIMVGLLLSSTDSFVLINDGHG